MSYAGAGKPGTKRRILAVWLTARQHAALRAEARRLGLPASRIVRAALAQLVRGFSMGRQ